VAPRATETQSASPLRFSTSNTPSNLTSDGHNWPYALPRETLAKHPEMLADRPESDLNALFSDGMFMLGGMYLRVGVENAGSDTLEITNIRLVNIVQECMPLALFFLVGNQGGATDEPLTLTLNADADKPVAHLSRNILESDANPYFGDKTIRIKPGDSQDLLIQGSARRRPYSFDIAFDVFIDGRNIVQILRNGQSPFRVTPLLCPTIGVRASMDPVDLAWLIQQKVEKVRGGVGDMKDYSPAGFSAPCNKL
jgi:hypothetical protein